jgi:ribosomal protein L25 (general stress protein Ctc)
MNRTGMCKHIYEYFDVLPAPCQPFIFYKGHDFEGYMIDEDHNIYFHNGLKYRKLLKLLMGGKYENYFLHDIEGNTVAVFLNHIDEYL